MQKELDQAGGITVLGCQEAVEEIGNPKQAPSPKHAYSQVSDMRAKADSVVAEATGPGGHHSAGRPGSCEGDWESEAGALPQA